MILLALALLAFATADLLRWSPEQASSARAAVALAGAVGAVIAVAALAGWPAWQVGAYGAAAAGAVGVWLLFDTAPPQRQAPGYPLAWITLVAICAFALSGSAPEVAGPISEWYSGLGFGFVEVVTVDRFLLGAASALFLLASCNRIVRLVLDAAGTPAAAAETTLRGGRLLGPMERLIVGHPRAGGGARWLIWRAL